MSPVAAALILVGVGSLLALRTVDVSGGSPLVNLIWGPQATPTAAMLGAKKVAEVVLFAAFVDLAIVAGLERGALVAALALAVLPTTTANSGALVWITAGAAVILAGRCLATRLAPTVADLAGGAFAFLGSVLVSPWLLALLGLVWLPRKNAPRRGLAALLVPLVAPFAIAAFVAFTRGAPLAPSDPLGDARVLGATLAASVPRTSLPIVWLALAFTALASPTYLLGSVSSLLAVALFFRLDLGALVVASILFALAVAAAVDRASFGRPWVANLAALTVFLFALAPTPRDLTGLLRANKSFDRDFERHCGEPSEWPGSADGDVLRVEASERTRRGCWIAFGNDHPELSGRYRAAFVAGAGGSPASRIEVVRAKDKQILASAPVPTLPAEASQPLPRTFIDYEVGAGPPRRVEHRVFFDGTGIVVFDGVEVEALP